MPKSQLKSGVLLSYLNLIIGNIIPFFYTPLMLRLLGQSEYGLYTLAHTIVGYLSLLSFGMGSAIVRYVTKYKVEGDRKKEQQMFGLFTFLYSCIAAAVLGLGILLAMNIGVFYGNLPGDQIEKMRILVLLCAVNSAITFAFTTYSSMVLVYERYIFRQVLGIFQTVLTPCSYIVVLLLGFSSVGMVLSATALSVVSVCLNIMYCSRRLKVKPIFKGMPFFELKSIFGFCFFTFLGSVVDMLFWATDKVIIGAAIGTVGVAIYNVGATFNTIVTSVSTTISGVLVPRVTSMVFKNCSREELTELFIRVGRLQYIIVSLIVSGFVVFGRQFIGLWAGSEYSESYYVALLTMLPVMVPLIQNTGLSIIMAQNKHKFRSIVYLIIAVINAVSTAFAVNYYGIIGAAVCSTVSYIVGQGLIMNWYYYKKTGINIPVFWLNILKMSLSPVLLIVSGLIVTSFFTIDKWLVLLAAIIIYTALFSLLMWFTGMNSYEKEIFKKPLKKIFKRKSV